VTCLISRIVQNRTIPLWIARNIFEAKHVTWLIQHRICSKVVAKSLKCCCNFCATLCCKGNDLKSSREGHSQKIEDQTAQIQSAIILMIGLPHSAKIDMQEQPRSWQHCDKHYVRYSCTCDALISSHTSSGSREGYKFECDWPGRGSSTSFFFYLSSTTFALDEDSPPKASRGRVGSRPILTNRDPGGGEVKSETKRKKRSAWIIGGTKYTEPNLAAAALKRRSRSLRRAESCRVESS